MSIALYAVVALLAAAFATVLYLRLSSRRLLQATQGGLDRIYSPLPTKPRVQVASSYGYPVFTVVFRNHLLLEQAQEQGLNQAFLQFIGELCKSVKPRGQPFSAELAVSFEHENKLTRAEAGVE